LNCYPAKLQTKLGTSYLVSNFGLRNGTASFSGDLPYVNSGDYADSLKSDPDIVVVMLGTNDSKVDNWNPDDYKEGLSKIVASYVELESAPTVYLVRSPYCFAVDGGSVAEYGIQPDIVATELGDIVSEVAREYDVTLIDMYSVTEGREKLFTSDGIHFNKRGYELIADTIYDVIK
jgi:lysophospholipase L1-like esterase